MRLKTDDPYEPQDYAIPRHRRPRRLGRIVAGVALFGFSGLVAAQMLEIPAEIAVSVARAPTFAIPDQPFRAKAAPLPEVASIPAIIAPLRQARLLDPSYALGATPGSFGRSVGLRTQFVARAAQARDIQVAALEEDADIAVAEAPLPAPRPADLAAAQPSFPAPPPRPVELSIAAPKPEAKPPAAKIARAGAAPPSAQTAAADGGSFLEKLFGARDPAGPALAYASPQDGAVRDYSPGSASGRAGYDRYTAIYDISARTVILPNGARLEAHSGLGEMLDNPSYAHVRMRGVTPPALYDLREREALFHGVRAIRLTPLNSAVHGRSGLLAHTYMLGPNGQSNGCVSFRDYNLFLQAYLKGEVKRLAVVAKL